MEAKEARKVLEDQFMLLARTNTKCEPGLISVNISCMLELYSTLYSNQIYKE